jgi:hypothetical protein
MRALDAADRFDHASLCHHLLQITPHGHGRHVAGGGEFLVGTRPGLFKAIEDKLPAIEGGHKGIAALFYHVNVKI